MKENWTISSMTPTLQALELIRSLLLRRLYLKKYLFDFALFWTWTNTNIIAVFRLTIHQQESTNVALNLQENWTGHFSQWQIWFTGIRITDPD